MNARRGGEVCPDCGAAIETPGAGCWLCGAGTASAAAPIARGVESVPASRYNPWAISLQSILLMVTLICVSLGVLVQFPGLGIALIVLSVPAFVRTLMLGKVWKAAGRPLTLGEKVLSMAGSLAVALLLVVSVSAAFVVVCFPLGLSQFEYGGPGGFPILFPLSFLVGGAAALAVGIGVANALWYQPLKRWNTRRELPTIRRRIHAFLEATGKAVTTIAGAAGGAFAFFLPFIWLLKSPPNQVTRTLIFSLLVVGFGLGGWFGWWLSRRWPKFFAIVGAMAIAGLISWWLMMFVRYDNSILARSLRGSVPVGTLVPIAFTLLFVGTPVTGFLVWRLWRWSESPGPPDNVGGDIK